MPVHGPFVANRKHIQMRTSLDLNAVQMSGQLYNLRFETRSNLKNSIYCLESTHGMGQVKINLLLVTP